MVITKKIIPIIQNTKLVLIEKYCLKNIISTVDVRKINLLRN